MNAWCFLLTRFLKILLNERFKQVYALKHAVEFFKHLRFWSLQKNQKLDPEFVMFDRVFKKLVRVRAPNQQR